MDLIEKYWEEDKIKNLDNLPKNSASEVLEKDLEKNRVSLRRQSKTRENLAKKLTEIKKFLIPVPPMKVQDEFVRRSSRIHELYGNQTANMEILDNLFHSLVQRAFKGELNTSDPDDEPVEQLLERIKAEKKAAPQRNKKRIRKKKK